MQWRTATIGLVVASLVAAACAADATSPQERSDPLAGSTADEGSSSAPPHDRAATQDGSDGGSTSDGDGSVPPATGPAIGADIDVEGDGGSADTIRPDGTADSRPDDGVGDRPAGGRPPGDRATGDPDAGEGVGGDDPSVDAAGGEGGTQAGDGVTSDEPSFDIGPPVDIDLDLARFPVDDAGLGGDPTASTTPGAPADPAEDAPVAIGGWAGVDRYLESVLIGPGNTAASVAVSIDGDIVHTAAFGVRDPATSDPAEPVDRFRIASISKTISAIVALTLVDDGTLSLDEPIGQRIADHVGLGPLPNGSRGLTLAQLLGHRSGFGKYDSVFFRGAAGDCEDAARIGLSSGAGGGGYVYSNMNYCLVGLLIEAVTGLPYEEVVYRRLLGPLGITGMRLAPTVDPGPDEIQHVTTPGRNYMETLGAAGAWIATPSDLVKILDSLDLSTPGFKPLTQATTFRLVVPVGGVYGQRGYGLGVISYGDGRFGHTGTIESTHAMVLDRGDGVIWAITVAGQSPGESTALEQIMNRALVAGGFVTG